MVHSVGADYDAPGKDESLGRRQMRRPLKLKAVSPQPVASSQRRTRSGKGWPLG